MMNNKYLNPSFNPDIFKLNQYAPEQFTDYIDSIYTAEMYEEINFMVPPNHFIELCFVISDKSFYYNGNTYVDGIRIEGIMLEPEYIKNVPGTKFLGARLFGNGLYPFFPLKGSEILNQNIAYAVPDEYQDLVLEIKHSKDDLTAISILYDLLGKMFNPDRDYETRLIKEYYNQLKLCPDEIPNIGEFCEQNNTNYTSLNRTFNKILGLSTKKFERLLKFSKVLKNFFANIERTNNKEINTEYFDQSHFIREFKYFMKMTPMEYLNTLHTNQEHRNFKDLNFNIV